MLGSGTSNGVPSLGVDYPPEFLANPKNHRTRPSLLLEGPEGNVLVDCAPEMRLQLLREGVRMIDAVILTHTHADHVMGMDDLRGFCLRAKRAMPIYADPPSQADVRRIFPYAFRQAGDGVDVPRFELRDLLPTLWLAGLDIRVGWVEHGPLRVAALRIGDFAYVTDVSRIPEETRPLLEGLDTLVLDAVRRRPHPNHFHLARALEVAVELAPRQTYLTHLSHDFDHDRANAELPPGVSLAYDGLRIPIAGHLPKKPGQKTSRDPSAIPE